MVWLWIFALCIVAASGFPEVRDLKGDPGFKKVVLSWRYESSVPRRYEFHIRYCEMQAWGNHRCRTKILDGDARIQENNVDRQYEVTIDNLRMATNYTFQVTPTLLGQTLQRARATGQIITLQTKGFSARATKCLSDHSEVEVETGPYFGGRIAVEDASDPRCGVQGDPRSPKTTYTLRIFHSLCGSLVNGSSIRTFILVQENLPILTHSTRRFLVLCTFSPDTFIVNAGVSLPRGDSNKVDTHDLRPIAKSVFEVDPAELLPEPSNSNRVSNVIDSRMQHEQRAMAAAHVSQPPTRREGQVMPHVILMAILVVGCLVGGVMAILWTVNSSRRLKHTGSMDPQIVEARSEMFENFENVRRDHSSPSSFSKPPCVALISVTTASEHLNLSICDPGQSEA